MRRTKLILLVCAVLASVCTTTTYADELPCLFSESKNITTGERFLNDSILHNGVIYPPEQYAEVNYVFSPTGKTRYDVPTHMRGCVCNIKACVRFCCPIGEVINESGKCVPNDLLQTNITHPIIDANGTIQSAVLDEQFGIIRGRHSCSHISTNAFNLQHVSDQSLLLTDLLAIHECFHHFSSICRMARSVLTMTRVYSITLIIAYTTQWIIRPVQSKLWLKFVSNQL